MSTLDFMDQFYTLSYVLITKIQEFIKDRIFFSLIFSFLTFFFTLDLQAFCIKEFFFFTDKRNKIYIKFCLASWNIMNYAALHGFLVVFLFMLWTFIDLFFSWLVFRSPKSQKHTQILTCQILRKKRIPLKLVSFGL